MAVNPDIPLNAIPWMGPLNPSQDRPVRDTGGWSPVSRVTQEMSREYNPFSVRDARGVPSPSLQSRERNRYLLPILTGTPEQEVDSMIDSGAERQLQNRALTEAELARRNYTEQRLEEFSVANEDAYLDQQVAELVELISEDPVASRFVDPAVAATVLNSDSDLAKRTLFRRLQNLAILQESMATRMESASQGGPNTRSNLVNNIFTWDFVDTFVSSPLGIIYTEQRIAAADRLVNLVSSDLPPEEVKNQIDTILEDIAAQGILTGDNRFMLGELFALLPVGNEAQRGSQRLWAAFDTVASLGGFAAATVRAGVRVGNRASDATAASMLEAVDDSAILISRTRENANEVQSVIERAARADNPTTSPVNPVNHSPSSITPISQRVSPLSPPQNTAMNRIIDENEALNNLRSVRGATAFDEVDIARLRERVRLEASNGSSRVIDNDLFVDDADNIIYTERLGTSRGNYFRDFNAAQKLADEVGGQVTDMGDGKYLVDLSNPVPITDDLFAATRVDELGTGFWAKYGSPGTQTTERLQSILLQTESIRSRIHDDLRRMMKKMEKTVNKKSKASVETVRNRLRDHPSESSRMTEYTPQEFREKFREVNGRVPTPAEENYYNFLVEMDVTSWYADADPLFKEAVSRGGRILKLPTWKGTELEDFRVLSRKVDEIDKDELVFDLDTNKFRRAEELSDKHNLFTMADELYEIKKGKFTAHVATKNPKSRRLYHTDVLPYNAGGRRSYVPNSTKLFVKQEQTATLADGRQVAATPRTALGVKTAKEAQIAVREINDIIDEIIPRLSPDGDEYQQVRAMDLDDVINRNNTWNKNITNTDELVDFFESYRLSFSRKMDYAADGDSLSAGGRRYLPGITADTTYGNIMRVAARPKNGRRDRPLVSFGGDQAPVHPTIYSSKQNIVRATAKRSEAAYLMASVNGLMRTIATMESGRAANKALPRALKGQYSMEDFRNLTLKGKIAKILKEDMIDTSTVEGKRLMLEAKKIDFRLRQQPGYAQPMENFKNDLSDALYGAGWTKTSSWMDAHSFDPLTAMRSAAFHVFMGMGNLYQFFLQSSQIVTGIIPIAGMNGAIGGAAAPFIRFLVANGHENVIRAFGRRLKPITGLNEDQFFEMVDLLRQDGRMITSVSVAELGEDAVDVTGTGLLKKVGDLGLIPFREGELTARIAAHAAAYMNYLKKFPDGNPRSVQGRRWIAREQDIYTQSMTSASRSPLQEYPFAQFLSYPWRMTEAILAGSFGGKAILTFEQKSRLLATHLAMFGAAGLGLGSVMDRQSQKGNLDFLSDDMYHAFRYGLNDVILSSLLGTKTSLSDNLAYAQGVATFVSNFIDATTIPAIFGPSGAVADSFTKNVFQFFASLKTGSGELIKQDFMTLARQLKSVDMSHNLYTAVTLGHYFSRNGRRIMDDDVDVHETIALAFGIPIAEYQEAYSLRNTMYNDSQYEKRMGERIERMHVGLIRSIREGDLEAADEFQKQIASFLLAIHETSPLQAQRILSNMDRDSSSYLDQTYVEAIRRDLLDREY